MTDKTQLQELSDDDLKHAQGGAINGETVINIPFKDEGNKKLNFDFRGFSIDPNGER